MIRLDSRYMLMAALAGALLLVGLSGAHAAKKEFQAIFNTEVNTDAEKQRCVDSTGVDLETLGEATATLRLIQFHAKTWLIIGVKNAAPDTLYTVWLKLQGVSPLTGSGVTALAHTDDIQTLIDVTPSKSLLKPGGDDGTGTDDLGILVNGFMTDQNGHGRFIRHLDFPIKKGAYQFQELDMAFGPVAIGTSPFTLRLASHCLDGKGHGHLPGDHERWFDWSFDSH